MATRIFEGIKFFQEILERPMANISVKFDQNPISSLREEDVPMEQTTGHGK